MSSFVPSHYQKAIFNWVTSSEGHGVVNAVAGSGKSRTQEECIREYIPSWNRVLNVAFNKHIQTAMEAKMPRHVESVTFNAFGWRLCRYNCKFVELKANKNDLILRETVSPYNEKERFYRLRQPVLRMIGILKALGEPNIDAWEDHSKVYGVEMGDLKPNDQFTDVLRTVYDRSVEDLSIMDFDDQVFQPIHRGWTIPAYSWVMIDEAQDTSPVQIEMATRMADSGRMLLVGDPDQSIYLFRGAHPDAMATLTRALNATELPLSVCYRCPDDVIECAQEEVPRIEAPTPNPNGKGEVRGWKDAQPTTEEFVRAVKSGDMVLCRTTAPLIKRCLQQLRMGKKAYVKGRDLVNQIIALVEQLHGDREVLEAQVRTFKTRGTLPRDDVPEFLDRLAAHKSEKGMKLAAAGRDAELLALEDRCDSIAAFADEARFVGEIILKVEAITSDEAQDGIAFMTGHKCKGLEAQDVWILRPDLCPHPKAKSELQKRQEQNLRYIMKTRSRSFLGFVQKEKEEK